LSKHISTNRIQRPSNRAPSVQPTASTLQLQKRQTLHTLLQTLLCSTTATVPLLCNQLRLLCSYRSYRRYRRYYRRYFAAQQQPCPFCAISCVYFAATEATDAKDAATDATLQRNTNRVVSVQKSCCYSADLICLHCCIHLLGGVHLKTSPVNCLSSAGLMPVPACLSMSTRSACLSMSTRSACLSMSTRSACLSMSTRSACLSMSTRSACPRAQHVSACPQHVHSQHVQHVSACPHTKQANRHTPSLPQAWQKGVILSSLFSLKSPSNLLPVLWHVHTPSRQTSTHQAHLKPSNRICLIPSHFSQFTC